MKLIYFIFAAFLCVGCGDESATQGDESHQPHSSQPSQSGWIILPSSSSLRDELQQRGFDLNNAITLRTEELDDSSAGIGAASVPTTGGVYYAPTYTPAFTNSPYSYSARLCARSTVCRQQTRS